MNKGSRLYQSYVRESVDPVTGEIRVEKIENSYRKNTLEQFTMVRFTDNDSWVKDLKPVLPLMLLMSQWIDATTNHIPLSSDRRAYLCEYFGLSNPRSLTTLLTMAIKLDALVRINGSSTAFMLNPSFIYRGSTKDLPKKLMQYANYKTTTKTESNFENE